MYISINTVPEFWLLLSFLPDYGAPLARKSALLHGASEKAKLTHTRKNEIWNGKCSTGVLVGVGGEEGVDGTGGDGGGLVA